MVGNGTGIGPNRAQDRRSATGRTSSSIAVPRTAGIGAWAPLTHRSGGRRVSRRLSPPATAAQRSIPDPRPRSSLQADGYAPGLTRIGRTCPEANLRDRHDDLRGRVNAVLASLSADPRDVSDPVEIAWVAGAARTSMTRGSGQMPQTPAAEVRLDTEKRRVPALRGRAPCHLGCQRVGSVEFRCGGTPRDGISRPTSRESGGCRTIALASQGNAG